MSSNYIGKKRSRKEANIMDSLDNYSQKKLKEHVVFPQLLNINNRKIFSTIIGTVKYNSIGKNNRFY